MKSHNKTYSYNFWLLRPGCINPRIKWVQLLGEHVVDGFGLYQCDLRDAFGGFKVSGLSPGKFWFGSKFPDSLSLCLSLSLFLSLFETEVGQRCTAKGKN